MTTVALSGQGFVESHLRSFNRALALYGQDELAGSIKPARVTPSTSAAYALEVARHWLAVAPACVRRAMEAANTDTPFTPVSNASGSSTWLSKAFAEKLIDKLQAGELINEEDIKVVGALSPLAAGILRDLKAQFTAIHAGYWGLGRIALGGESHGQPVMEALQTRMFWDAARRTATGCSGSTASVTAEEKWDAFKDGAKESARAIADAAGSAAGFIAATAGQAIGAGVGGFLGELGVVNVALGAGALYVAWRFI